MALARVITFGAVGADEVCIAVISMAESHMTTTLWNAIAWSAFFHFDGHTEEGFEPEGGVGFWVPCHLPECKEEYYGSRPQTVNIEDGDAYIFDR